MRNQDGIISEWFEIDDAIEYQFMKQGAYKILAKFSNKARMYEIKAIKAYLKGRSFLSVSGGVKRTLVPG